VLWEMKKPAARDAWKEIEPGIARIAALLTARETEHAPAA
jgi:chromosome partitioning protein